MPSTVEVMDVTEEEKEEATEATQPKHYGPRIHT